MNWRLAFLINLVILISLNLACEKENIVVSPIIFGHAGTTISSERAVFPPNTEKSILYALDALNADGVEVDVQLTKDDSIVLFHDNFIDNITDQIGCIGDYTFDELRSFEFYKRHQIVVLSEVLKWTRDRDKKLFLDVKHFDFCEEALINVEAFNSTFNNNIKSLSVEERKSITLSSKNIELLGVINDTSIIKGLETINIEQGLGIYEAAGIDIFVMPLNSLTKERELILKENDIPFCLFGIKTKSEIRNASQFNAVQLITDNISATRKNYK